SPLSLWERVRERAVSRKACIGAVREFFERGGLPQLEKCPLPNPPPQGRERVAADFAVAGSLKSRLDKQPLITGRLKNKKQPAQAIFFFLE
ncbi:TPA: hypothetical protein ACKLXY_002220, partial [Neisseria gonorrhoeae]